ERPVRSDGSHPEMCVVAIGSYGARTLGYRSPLQLIFLYDSIDYRNVWHRRYYEAVVEQMMDLLRGDPSRGDGLDIDLRVGPRFEVGVSICSVHEAARVYETSGRVNRRMEMASARVVAGSVDVGLSFLGRIEPWVYPSLHLDDDRAELESIRRRLHRRAGRAADGQTKPSSSDQDANGESTTNSESNDNSPESSLGSEQTEIDLTIDLNLSPGGRLDIERCIGLMQAVHGGQNRIVRQSDFYEAIDALQHQKILSTDDAALLAKNYSRLCRIKHQTTIAMDHGGDRIFADSSMATLLAWQLGIRNDSDQSGAPTRLSELIRETLQGTGACLQKLMADIGPAIQPDLRLGVDSNLILDPAPDGSEIERMLRRHRFNDLVTARANLDRLARENVRFLSGGRCRHAFSVLAPSLLPLIADAPDPDATLAELAEVTDSIGAKATLWNLLHEQRPLLQLMVRLCSSAPYLQNMLVDRPGMLDELIDSLLMDKMPSPARLDAHSIDIMRGERPQKELLKAFRDSSHLIIGVRDLLGKERVESVLSCITRVGDSLLGRAIEASVAQFGQRYGDPVDADEQASGMIAIAFGAIARMECSYTAPLLVGFLHESPGQTKRRVGGPRATLSNDDFFGLVRRDVMATLDNRHDPSAGTFETQVCRFNDVFEDFDHVLTLDEWFRLFEQDDVPFRSFMDVFSSRVMYGSREVRTTYSRKLEDLFSGFEWREEWNDGLAAQFSTNRMPKPADATFVQSLMGPGGIREIENFAIIATLFFLPKLGSREWDGDRSPSTRTWISRLADARLFDADEMVQLSHSYSLLKRIEANLELMNSDDSLFIADTNIEHKMLASLLRHPNPDEVTLLVDQAKGDAFRIINQSIESMIK
ncbi:MAG: hypothetical protein AAF664_22650, partial [Planctomycetota bacterium]